MVGSAVAPTMVTAYIMVITAAGRSDDLIDAIRAIDGVITAHVVAGDFDIIAEIEAPTIEGVRNTVVGEVQELEGIGTTRTYIALD